jgi:hypothetical protein
MGCSNLTSVKMGNGITSTGVSVFEDCRSLTSVIIPDSVTEIGRATFMGCSNLTSVKIPNSVTEIEGAAFSGCIGLISLTIPDNVTDIGPQAFYHCTGELIINSKKLVESDYSKNGCCAWLNDSNFTQLTIGDNIVKIGENAFRGCDNITSITITAKRKKNAFISAIAEIISTAALLSAHSHNFSFLFIYHIRDFAITKQKSSI